MFHPLIKELRLPPAQIPLPVEVPDKANVSGDHHCAVSISLNHQIFTGDPQFGEDATGRFIKLRFLLVLVDKFFREEFRDLDSKLKLFLSGCLGVEVFQVRKGGTVGDQILRNFVIVVSFCGLRYVFFDFGLFFFVLLL